MKPKSNYKPGPMDNCQTPSYALDPLMQYLDKKWLIWECAAGEGMIQNTLLHRGYSVIGTDVQDEHSFDFLVDESPIKFDCIVTNPPFSLKYKFIARCYQIGKPFALLMPVETLGAKAAQVLFAEYGIQVIFMHPRINFKMPNKGWNGTAQFPTAWFTWGMGVPWMQFVHVKHTMSYVMLSDEGVR